MRGIRVTAWAALVCAAGLPVVAQTPHPATTADAETAVAPVLTYIGVMGEVANPGVYEFTTDRLILSEVVDQAGRTTPEFSGAFEIIRNTRPVPTRFYAARYSEQLLPGDIIIAERLAYPGLSAQSGAGQSTKAAEDSAPGYKWLGFFNLLDRPVVVKMKNEHASLVSILIMLRQPQEVLRSVTICETGAANGLPRHGHGPASTLPTGTVLAFNLEATRYDLIPTAAVETLPLPRVAQQRAAEVEVAEEAVAEPTVVAQPAEDAPFETVTQVTTIAASNQVELLPGPSAGELPTISPRRRAAHEPVQVAEVEQPLLVPEALDEAALPPAIAAPVLADTYAAPVAITEAESVTAESTQQSAAATDSSSAGNTVIIIVAGIVGVLVTAVAFGGLWVMIGRETASHTVAVATAAAAMPIAKTVAQAAPARLSVNHLDALVKDELPLVEEAVKPQLPRDLQGQSAAPRKIRIDAAHTTKKPHIQSADGAGIPGSLSLMFETTTDDRGESWERASFDTETATAKPSVLDRVLSSVHGAKGRP